MIVPRTCTEISAGNEDQHREKESRPLEAFRDAPAYVLLGDPGAGKTTAFEAEHEKLGEKACLITARNFLTFNPQSHPEWRDRTLFIDGLDEIRVGANDARTPFDQIRGRLDALGKPHFRLSCREADWLGANDQKHLESVSPDSKVTVLRLNPLTDSDIADILNDRPDIGDAQTFIALAKDRGVDGLLANPQTLKMLADVVAQGGGWPISRKETFERACGQMVREHNEEHEAAQESNSPPTPDQLLDAAGHLCAVQLISGVAGFTLRGQTDEDYPAPDQCDYDRREVLRSALVTRLFKSESNNRFAPFHRHIAEFLSARHLAQIIERDLPARRVIALIVGEDGTVVTEMRGLSAWLAAHSKDARADLIERDPIGVGLYGDIREFSTDEKRALLKALNREGVRLRFRVEDGCGFWCARHARHGTRAIKDPEQQQSRPEHQMFTDFVLRVLRRWPPAESFRASARNRPRRHAVAARQLCRPRCLHPQLLGHQGQNEQAQSAASRYSHWKPFRYRQRASRDPAGPALPPRSAAVRGMGLPFRGRESGTHRKTPSVLGYRAYRKVFGRAGGRTHRQLAAAASPLAVCSGWPGFGRSSSQAPSSRP